MTKRIGLAQIEIFAGHPQHNTNNILYWINRARQQDLDLIAFPEMAIPGYLVGDEWENDAFVQDCLECNEIIRQASSGITVVWGSLDADFQRVGDDGRTRKYNAALIAANGEWLSNGVQTGRSYKTLLPNYREFDDRRYFFSQERWAAEQGLSIQSTLQPFQIPDGSRVGLMLCEDMWDGDYALKPGSILEANGAEILLNLSCSPWTWRKNSKRHRVAKELLAQSGCKLYYVNATGIQNNGKDIYALDGASTIYGPDGAIIAMHPPFSEGILTDQSGTSAAANLPPQADPTAVDTAETLLTLVQVLRRWFAAIGNPKVAIGLSGGIDSALVATLLAIALGPDQVWAVNMPSRFNSSTTKNAAALLAANLGIHYGIVPIQESAVHTVIQVEETSWQQSGLNVKAPVTLSLSSLNRENIQARDRGGRILAAVSSALGGVFTNNGNKTETAFGYATLYGDINGAIAPIGDLYKNQVYALARLINQLFATNILEAATGPDLADINARWNANFTAASGDTLIPQAILDVVPSAELSEAQNVDEGKGDPIRYDYHDALLYQFIDGGFQADYTPAYGRRDPFDLLQWYAHGEIDFRLGIHQGTCAQYCPDLESFIKDLEEKWSLYKGSTFKRIQSPPIIALSKRAFGFDLRESVNPVYFSMQYQRLRDQLLPAKASPSV